MKRFFYFTICCLLVIGCRNPSSPAALSDGQVPVPEALEKPKSESGMLSKRNSYDLVEELYKEAVSNTPELKQLEDRANDWNSRYTDSLQPFRQYDAKNQDYYEAAGNHTNRIQDSVLKTRIAALVASHAAAYNENTALYNRLLASISSGQVSLADQFIVLRIVKTLPMIAAYQQGKRPSAKPMEAVLADLEKVIREAEKQAR